MENEPIDKLGARVVRVELFDGSESSSSIEPLIQVDLVLPLPVIPESPESLESPETPETSEVRQ